MSGTVLLCEVTDPRNPRPMIPKNLKNLVLNLFHHGDHPGIKESLRRVSREYYWPNMKNEVTSFCQSCHPCQVAKQATTVNPGIGDFPVPDKEICIHTFGHCGSPGGIMRLQISLDDL